MIDSVLNEYVHVDEVLEFSIGETVVTYEPLDNPVDESTLSGNIMLQHMQHRIYFCMLDGLISVDSDTVVGSSSHNGVIKFTFEKYPGDHYLTVSYDCAGSEKEDFKVSWLQEGF